jgi:CRISPR/Cas system-associated exonuclease Cas4 (RecB family)
MSEAVHIIPGDFSPSAQLAAEFERFMRNHVKRNGPSARTRASSIGNECERNIFYERTVPADERIPHSPELQAIFDLGNDMERIAVRRLEDMGAEIVQRGKDYVDREHEISGHIDAKIRMRGWPRALPAEIKGLNPYTGEGIHTLEDIRSSRQSWVRKYYDQLQTYLLLDGEELGVFVLFNKSTGWPRFIDCPIDLAYAETLIKKADRIKLAVVKDEAPPRKLGSDCKRCPFLTICGPDVDLGKGVQIVDNDEVAALLARRDELEAAAREFTAIDKQVKEALPKEEGEFLIGDFVISGRRQHRRGYEVKPTSFIVRDISRAPSLAK